MSLSTPVAAGGPTEQLKGATDRVLQLVQDPALKAPDKTEVRQKEIRAVADEIFDWQASGTRALARHWPPLSAAQRAEFSTLFADELLRKMKTKQQELVFEQHVPRKTP
jgi:ABC-type transporter MlaC component